MNCCPVRLATPVANTASEQLVFYEIIVSVVSRVLNKTPP